MSQSMTFTPACARAVAIPSPIPDAAPVTKAVFPARSFIRPPDIKTKLFNSFQDYRDPLRTTIDIDCGSIEDWNSVKPLALLHLDNQHMHLRLLAPDAVDRIAHRALDCARQELGIAPLGARQALEGVEDGPVDDLVEARA